MHKLEEYVISIKDFPKQGIIFRDITNIIEKPEGLKLAIDVLADKTKEYSYNKILGPEARGFIFGVGVAYRENKGFVPIRKEGKLPREVVSKTFDLEYGTATIEMHKNSINKGDRVIIVDDLLATGGTTRATIDLVKEQGGEVVACLYLIELKGLKGRERLNDVKVDAIIQYEGA